MSAAPFTIELEAAVKVSMPQPRALEPAGFETPDGKTGWMVGIPGHRPLATPAYAGGRLFLGGGYGSHEFYAFDAETGSLLWQRKTSDDGPTAAVVEGRYVAFNTESCSIIVCDVETGEVVWERWLGDPLMSQPAIDQGRVYIAYPTGQRPPKDKKTGHEGRRTGHALLCAELSTGEQLWERPISGDVITAPVIDEGRVYVTCFDGRSYCFDGADGSALWEQDNRGTSAPLVVAGRVIVTEKQVDGSGAAPGVPLERLHRLYAGSGAAYSSAAMARKLAMYLSRGSGGGSPVSPTQAKDLDAAVGFASAPQAAKLEAAAAHLGISGVAGAWAYQGSRPAYRGGRVFNAQGKSVHCVIDHGVDEDTETAWEGGAKGAALSDEAQVFLPPSLGREHLYLAGTLGHVLCMRQDSGAVEFMYDLGRPISAQPCLALGSVLLGTLRGDLICLRTGRDDADGWYMWGGNARHNKTS